MAVMELTENRPLKEHNISFYCIQTEKK